jgi:4-oxalocrotonate tautomerase
MPHVVIKMLSGRSEQNKTAVADAVSRAVMGALGIHEDAISVAIEDVDQRDWREKVYQPDIIANGVRLYKKPDYTM